MSEADEYYSVSKSSIIYPSLILYKFSRDVLMIPAE